MPDLQAFIINLDEPTWEEGFIQKIRFSLKLMQRE